MSEPMETWVLRLLWVLPGGLLMAYALWRFVRALSPGKPITSEDESKALSLTIASDDLSGDDPP